MSDGAGRSGRGRGQKATKPTRAGAQAPSQRQLRVAEQIRHLLAEALLRGAVHDPRLSGVSLTVGEVRTTRDLRNAVVFTSELGGPLRPETLAALEHAAPWLSGQVARGMHLKFAPRLRFVADDLYDEAARMDRLLSEALARVAPDAEENEHGPGEP